VNETPKIGQLHVALNMIIIEWSCNDSFWVGMRFVIW